MKNRILLIILSCGVLVASVYLWQKSRITVNQPPITSITATQLIPFPTKHDAEHDSTLTGKIYFEDKGGSYVLNLGTSSKTKLTDGSTPSLSPDRSKLLSIQTSDFEGVDKLMVESIATGNNSSIASLSAPSAGADWSPDGQYILVDQGTAPGNRGMSIYRVDDKQLITDRLSNPRSVQWIDPLNFIFNDVASQNTGDYPCNNISEYSIETKQTKILIEASPLSCISIEDKIGQIIFYTKGTVNSSDDWTDYQGKTITTYWTMNLDGSNNKEITRQDLPEMQLYTKLHESLPDLYNNSEKYNVLNPIENPNTGWILFFLDDNSDTAASGYIAAVNTKAKNTFHVISTATTFSTNSTSWIY